MKPVSPLHEPMHKSAPHPTPLPVQRGEISPNDFAHCAHEPEIRNSSPSPPLEERAGERRPLSRSTSSVHGEGAVPGSAFQRVKSHWANSQPAVTERRPLLLLSEDEVLCWNLLMAASQVGRKLVRGHPANGPQTLRIVKPDLVLLDLDLPEEAAWETADALLEHEDCPPLILLTSRGKQSDFDTAIQAGCLIEKNAAPAKVLQLVELRLRSTTAAQREQNAMLRLVIRWLKPCSWSVQVVPLNRFWGINE
jgi:CheY-like chemotaxis protein